MHVEKVRRRGRNHKGNDQYSSTQIVGCLYPIPSFFNSFFLPWLYVPEQFAILK